MTMLLACNWKMNPAPKGFDAPDSVYHAENVIVFPAYTDIGGCVWLKIKTGAQFASTEPNGARTGDVSMQMIKDMGCEYVLCGHSERRKYHGETDEDVAAQAAAALKLGLTPIVCIGETDEEKSSGKMLEVLTKQIKHLPKDQNVIIAYEPVWAIGTGKIPSTSDVAEAAAVIKKEYGSDVKVLYGGSLDDKNCKELLSTEGIGGALIGGASLKPEKMAAIVAIAKAL